jgi:uncharacterized BrkB/YihY/UPF0761 family membrane protein
VGVFLTLLVVGLVLSIVGTIVEGLLWLTVIGILMFIGAAAHVAFSRRSKRPTG